MQKIDNKEKDHNYLNLFDDAILLMITQTPNLQNVIQVGTKWINQLL